MDYLRWFWDILPISIFKLLFKTGILYYIKFESDIDREYQGFLYYSHKNLKYNKYI